MTAPVTTEPAAVAAPRYHSLDSLRAVMMLLGVVIHAVLPYLPDPEAKLPYGDTGAANGAYLLVIVFIHSFRMPIFFLMAGLFAALLATRRGGRGLLDNRFRRIVLPFAVGWAVLFPLMHMTRPFFRAGRGLGGLRAAVQELVSGRVFSEPDLTHLWFLYYLAFLYPIGLAALALWRKLAPDVRAEADRLFRKAVESPVHAGLFALPTAITLWPMESAGWDTPLSFRPSPAILAAYGVFFAFGWALHAHADLLPAVGRHAWKNLFLALFLWPVSLFASTVFWMTLPVSPPALRLLTVITGALVTWLFAFGITGLFLRFFERPIPTMRYLTDASYWVYLAHLPLMFWLAALIAPLPLMSPAKVLVLILAATGVLLLLYHFAVRSTFLGLWLNGRRYPRRSPRAAEGPEVVAAPAALVGVGAEGG